MFEKLHPRYHVTQALCHDLMVYMVFDELEQEKSEFLLFLSDVIPVGFTNARIICFDFFDQDTIELLTDVVGKEHWLFYKDTKEYIQIEKEDANIFHHALLNFNKDNSQQGYEDTNTELVYSTKK